MIVSTKNTIQLECSVSLRQKCRTIKFVSSICIDLWTQFLPKQNKMPKQWREIAKEKTAQDLQWGEKAEQVLEQRKKSKFKNEKKQGKLQNGEIQNKLLKWREKTG